MESVILMSNSQTIENYEIKQVVFYHKMLLYDYEYKTSSKFVHIVYYMFLLYTSGLFVTH